jgi:hypothetical protein
VVFNGLPDNGSGDLEAILEDRRIQKKKLIDIGLRGFHRILKKFLDGYYQDIGWFVRLLILVNQLV